MSFPFGVVWLFVAGVGVVCPEIAAPLVCAPVAAEPAFGCLLPERFSMRSETLLCLSVALLCPSVSADRSAEPEFPFPDWLFIRSERLV
jgi:hypothetical protein